MYSIIERLEMVGVVPVIKIEALENAVPLARALCEGGLPVAEITFRTRCAGEAIRLIKEALPHMLVGAGTVLTVKQVDEAIAAGAEFVVSPGLNEKVVTYCNEKGILILPGCANPSDIEKAIELGLEVVKFFPAEAAGGLPMIQAMSAPYSQMRFMPTGGINEKNLTDYLGFSKIVACGGSWMVPETLLRDEAYERIRELTRKAVQTMLGFNFHHMGMAMASETSQVGLGKLQYLMGIEQSKDLTREGQGYITYSVNHIKRTAKYLRLQGIIFEEHDTELILSEKIQNLEIRLVQK